MILWVGAPSMSKRGLAIGDSLIPDFSYLAQPDWDAVDDDAGMWRPSGAEAVPLSVVIAARSMARFESATRFCGEGGAIDGCPPQRRSRPGNPNRCSSRRLV